MSKTLRHDVEQEVRRVVSEIKSICPNSRIYLFGSAVDNNAVNIRDIDFLIENKHDYLVPTTGAGGHVSLLGNTLERGYGLTPWVDHFLSFKT